MLLISRDGLTVSFLREFASKKKKKVSSVLKVQGPWKGAFPPLTRASQCAVYIRPGSHGKKKKILCWHPLFFFFLFFSFVCPEPLSDIIKSKRNLAQSMYIHTVRDQILEKGGGMIRLS